MERNCAACAMEWSIELEKALRAKNPGKHIEGILRLGPRLKQWSGEPEATMAVYNMFDLIPGEDRLFANAIFLRLADAFQFGDKSIRIAIVQVFLSLVKICRNKKQSKRIKGILSKSRVHNHSELLRRVKVVFDTGDIESRTLALLLFGCMADFAKDSAQIRYLVLSSLVSSDVLEVRSSLFAAGCFSELADDFAPVVLEILVNILNSSETLAVVRKAVARVFPKLGCSYSIANKTYKAGLKLVLNSGLNSSEEEFLVAMLVSLSKLAYKSTLLSSEQVEFLLLLFNGEVTLRLQATALRCLHFIFVKGMRHSLVSARVVNTLLSIIDGAEVPSNMQYEALQILDKVLLCAIRNLTGVDMPKLADLFTVVKNVSESPIMSKSLLAIRVLVNLVINLRRTDKVPAEFCTLPLPSQVVSLIMDRITLLVKPHSDLSEFNSAASREIKSLLQLLLLLVEQYQDLCVLVLDKVKLFIEYLVNCHNNTDNFVNGVWESKGQQTKVSSALAIIINGFVVSCLVRLYWAGAVTNEVFDQVKLLVDCVCKCSIFDCYTHMIYSLMLESQTVWGQMVNGNKDTGKVDTNSCKYMKHCTINRESISLELSRRMFAQKYNWPAYRAGMYAACQGTWFIATFIFGQLILKVRSDIYRTWLKLLAQLAHSEGRIQQILVPKPESRSKSFVEMKQFAITSFEDNFCGIGKDTAENNHEPKYSQALAAACQSINSVRRTLETSVTSSDYTFCFQRWFLALRSKVLGAVADIFKILNTMSPKQGSISNEEQLGLRYVQQITDISFQLERLAREFDLIATSFVGIDRRSLAIIKSLALNCSLLAFSAGFALYLESKSACNNSMHCGPKISNNSSIVMLIQNLAGRLWNLDREISANLCNLSEVAELSNKCFHLQPGSQILDRNCEIKDILDVCGYTVSGIVCLQNEAKEAHDEVLLSEVTKKGLRLLSNVISKWVHLPFHLPKYFFKFRPYVGSELFVSNADKRNIKGLSVMAGCDLSLYVCLQPRNLPQDLPLHLTKFYCILSFSQKFIFNKQDEEQSPRKSEPWESTDMIEMNEKLFRYVTQRKSKTNYGKRRRDNDFGNDNEIFYAYVEFEPNVRGQGFSTCLLDVSSFPAGSYRIKWHSSVDNHSTYWSLLPLNSEPVFTIL